MSASNAPGEPACCIGVDVGGSKIAAGLVTFPEGRVHKRCVVPTARERGGEAALDEVLRLATELKAEALRSRCELRGIGLGVCELVDRSGRIASAHCLDWSQLEPARRLSQLAPTVIEADVRAAALAEAWFGAGKSLRVFVYVTIGTGISCCLVVDRMPFLGGRGLTGTLASGRIPLRDVTPQAKPGLSLEDLASGPALVGQFTRAGGTARKGEDVLAAASAGDAKAERVVKSAGRAIGGAIGWLVNVLDPDAIVIGGGLGLCGGLYWESLVESARAHIWSDLHRQLPIVLAETGPDAGIIGAAIASWFSQLPAGADRRSAFGSPSFPHETESGRS